MTENVKTQRPDHPAEVSITSEPLTTKALNPESQTRLISKDNNMARKTKDSQEPVSSSFTKTPEEASTRRMVLRVRKSEATKRLSSLVRDEEKEKSVFVKRSKTKQKKKGVKVDPKMPKKPPTAFFYYLEDFRKEFQEQNPDIKTMREVGKACGEKWKTLSYEGKVKYYDIAMKKRAEFDEAMAEYIKRKESGEDEETEDDQDYDI